VFDVASIRPSKSADDDEIFRPTGDGIHATNMTMHDLIRQAYVDGGYVEYAIAGAPAWVESDKFDVEAKVDDATAKELKNLGWNEREAIFSKMLAALLLERCKLIVHMEMKEAPAYALVVTKNGPKLKPGTVPSAAYAGMAEGILHFTGKGGFTVQDGPVKRLASMVSSRLGRPVLDKTGLTGKYDYALEWVPEQPVAPIFSASENRTVNASQDTPDSLISDALQEQLGLKLEPAKAPVEVIVIDHVEKPTAN
jgi:uncharacterized protein (TIGR03435 family)